MGDSVAVPHIASDQWELAWTSLMNTQTNFFTSICQKMYSSTIENLDIPAAYSRQTMKKISHLIAVEPSFGGQKP
jgi:hypothetical protein